MVSQAGNPTAGKVSKLLSNTEFAKDETSEVERLAVGRTVTELGLRRMNHHLFGYYKDVCSERSSESDSLLSELPTSQIATFAGRKHKDNYFECAKVEQVGKDRTPGPRPEVRGNVFSVEVTDPSITSGACISFWIPKSGLFRRSCLYSHVTTANCGTRREYRFTLRSIQHASY